MSGFGHATKYAPGGLFFLDTSGLLTYNHTFPGLYDFDGFFAPLPLKYFPRTFGDFPGARQGLFKISASSAHRQNAPDPGAERPRLIVNRFHHETVLPVVFRIWP